MGISLCTYNVKFNTFLHRNEHAQRTVDSEGCRLSVFFIFDLVWPIQTMFWDFQGSLLYWGKKVHHLCPFLFDPFSKRKKKDILVQIECDVYRIKILKQIKKAFLSNYHMTLVFCWTLQYFHRHITEIDGHSNLYQNQAKLKPHTHPWKLREMSVKILQISTEIEKTKNELT